MRIVRLTEEAFNQLIDHPYLTEDTIIGIVKDSTFETREYADTNHFRVVFHRKKNKKWVTITIWVHEKPQEYVVYGIHSVGLSKRKR